MLPWAGCRGCCGTCMPVAPDEHCVTDPCILVLVSDCGYEQHHTTNLRITATFWSPTWNLRRVIRIICVGEGIFNGNSTSRTSTKWWPRHTESWRLWGGDERKLSELFSVFGVLLCMSCAQYTQVHVSKPQVCCFCMFFRFGIWYTVSKPCLGVLCIPNIYFFLILLIQY